MGKTMLIWQSGENSCGDPVEACASWSRGTIWQRTIQHFGPTNGISGVISWIVSDSLSTDSQGFTFFSGPIYLRFRMTSPKSKVADCRALQARARMRNKVSVTWPLRCSLPLTTDLGMNSSIPVDKERLTAAIVDIWQIYKVVCHFLEAYLATYKVSMSKLNGKMYVRGCFIDCNGKCTCYCLCFSGNSSTTKHSKITHFIYNIFGFVSPFWWLIFHLVHLPIPSNCT